MKKHKINKLVTGNIIKINRYYSYEPIQMFILTFKFDILSSIHIV